jgi:hypothetical protein
MVCFICCAGLSRKITSNRGGSYQYAVPNRGKGLSVVSLVPNYE